MWLWFIYNSAMITILYLWWLLDYFVVLSDLVCFILVSALVVCLVLMIVFVRLMGLFVTCFWGVFSL